METVKYGILFGVESCEDLPSQCDCKSTMICEESTYHVIDVNEYMKDQISQNVSEIEVWVKFSNEFYQRLKQPLTFWQQRCLDLIGTINGEEALMNDIKDSMEDSQKDPLPEYYLDFTIFTRIQDLKLFLLVLNSL